MQSCKYICICSSIRSLQSHLVKIIMACITHNLSCELGCPIDLMKGVLCSRDVVYIMYHSMSLFGITKK